MGTVWKRVARMDARVVELAREKLPPDDRIEAAIVVAPASVVVLGLVFLAGSIGVALWPGPGWPVLVAEWLVAGAYLAFAYRESFVVLSTTKLLIVRFAFMSSRRVDGSEVLDRSEVDRVEWRPWLGAGRLVIAARGRAERFQVGWQSRAKAEVIAARLAGDH